MKTEPKNHICNKFYGISCKALFRWNKSSKNTDISILSNFLAIFSDFFSISRNFTKYYLHAKFQINWSIQTEITEGGRICPPPLQPYQSAKRLACLGINHGLFQSSLRCVDGFQKFQRFRVKELLLYNRIEAFFSKIFN